MEVLIIIATKVAVLTLVGAWMRFEIRKADEAVLKAQLVRLDKEF